MKNKQIRRIIILIMCLVLVFNLAVSAYASSSVGSWSTVSLPADVAVSSVMNGLGVLPGESPEAYNGIVDSCVDYLIEQGRVISGKIDAWKREQVQGTPWRYGLDVSIIDVIRAWLYNAGILKNNTPIAPPSQETAFSDAWTKASSAPFACYYTTVYGWRIMYSLDPNKSFSYNSSNNMWELSMYNVYYMDSDDLVWRSNMTGFLSFSTKPLEFGTNATDYIGPSTDYDLTLGYVPPLGIPLSEAYPIWDDNHVLVPPIAGGGSESDDDVIVYPIAPGNTVEDTQDKTQEEVWDGDATITDSPAIPETVTLADILSSILTIPQAIFGSIAQALSNFFGISGTADAYAISLTDFFPFCIPFDIYEFLSVLSAAPEAPVFHWEIPVPQLGRTFDIDVDLSPWDPVAAVFRTFELLAFIVGLGLITREKFLRS